MKKFLSIQYLRGFAAMAVVIFHEAEDSNHWFYIGSAGVDLFFIISGFIMYFITEDNEKNPKTFLVNRLIRIVPLYWSVTIFSVILCIIHPNLMWHEDISITHLIFSLFFIPHRGVSYPDSIQPTLLQGWTLNIEMFFYGLMAISLLLPRKQQLAFMSLVLIIFVSSAEFVESRNPLFLAYTNSHLLEFVGGLCIGRVWMLGQLPKRVSGIFMAGVGFIILGLEQYFEFHTVSPGPVFQGIPAAMVVLGTLSIEANGGVFMSRSLKILGDASYSIYLTHSIIEAVINRIPFPFLIKTSLAIVLSALVGISVFYIFERRVNAVVRRIAVAGGLIQK